MLKDINTYSEDNNMVIDLNIRKALNDLSRSVSGCGNLNELFRIYMDCGRLRFARCGNVENDWEELEVENYEKEIQSLINVCKDDIDEIVWNNFPSWVGYSNVSVRELSNGNKSIILVSKDCKFSKIQDEYSFVVIYKDLNIIYEGFNKDFHKEMSFCYNTKTGLYENLNGIYKVCLD